MKRDFSWAVTLAGGGVPTPGEPSRGDTASASAGVPSHHEVLGCYLQIDERTGVPATEISLHQRTKAQMSIISSLMGLNFCNAKQDNSLHCKTKSENKSHLLYPGLQRAPRRPLPLQKSPLVAGA